jgi:hypothetical protein
MTLEEQDRLIEIVRNILNESEELYSMKKVILCFAHKCPEQVNLLIQQLLHDTNGDTDIYLHIDKNNESMKGQIVESTNVIFIEHNIPIQWGNDSMVNALLASFAEISTRNKQYDYFLICTGQDLLVKAGLDEFLMKNSGKIYLDTRVREPFQRQMLTHSFPAFMCAHLGGKSNPKRIIRGAYVRLIKAGLIPQRKVRFDIDNIVFYYSYNWSAMPYEVFLYIVHFLNINPGFMDLYHNTYLPEDGFLGTILMNSPFKDNVVFDDDGKSHTLTYWSELVLSHMKTITGDDIKSIEKSGCFFARKFDISTDRDVIDYYVQKILEKEK